MARELGGHATARQCSAWRSDVLRPRWWIASLLTGVTLVAVTALGPAPAALAQPASVCRPNPSPPNPTDPSMIIVRPLAGVRVSSPLALAGRARVFEAAVSVDLALADGRIVASGHLLAAESGPALAPFQGTLAFSVASETAASSARATVPCPAAEPAGRCYTGTTSLHLVVESHRWPLDAG